METKAQSNSIPPWILFLGIMVVCVLVFNGLLVYRSQTMHQDMVRDDYYRVSLSHDKVTLAESRALTLGQHLQIEIKDGMAWMQLGPCDTASLCEVASPITQCEIQGYRPSQDSLDFHAPLGRMANHSTIRFEGALPKMHAGWWRLKFQCHAGNELWLTSETRVRI